jgi:hypothetical protein
MTVKAYRHYGFSLFELLLVSGIAALIIGTIVVTLKPFENTQKSRDTQRLGDLRNLHLSIQAIRNSDPTAFFGATNTIYVSLPDTNPNCSSWSLPSPPTGWIYRCVASTTLQKTDGSGWIPINFEATKLVKLKQLPIDPINQIATSTGNQGYYYTYRLIAINNHKLTSYLEFEQNRGPNSVSGTDGGNDPNLYEVFQNIEPPTAPTAPRNLSALSSDQKVRLTWIKPSSTGGLPVKYYKIYRGLSSENLTFLTNVDGRILTYTDTGLTNGVTYYYAVSALNAVGESPKSNEVNAKPVGPPTAPQNLTATSSPNKVTLNWSLPVLDGGSAIINYKIYQGTSTDNKIFIATTTNLTYTATGLTNGVTYYYQVSAVNAVGEGQKSNEASSTPQAIPPDAPQNLRGSPTLFDITLNWDPPANDGGSVITTYNIYHGTSPGSIIFLNTTSDTNYLHTGLNPGTTHYYQVSAVNSVGEGPRTDVIKVITESTTSTPPQNLKAQPGDRNVTLSWQAPASDGGSAITNYRLYRATSSGAETFLTEVGNVLTYTDTGLTNSLTYYYQVTAVNANGESDRSNEASTTPAKVPSAPRNLNATAATSQITLNWQEPIDNGGSPITNYKIYQGTSDTYQTFLTKVGNVLTYTDTNLINGIRYYYRVSAVNAIGEGPKSNIANAKPTGPPTAPRNLNARGYNGKATLNWQPPESDGGAAINHYIIYRGTNPGGESYLDQTGNVLTYTDTGLSTTTTYYYQVSAVNNFGEGTKSNEASTIPGIDWDKRNSGNPAEAYSVVETEDGGYIVAGYIKTGGIRGSDAWVVKFKSNGDVEWQKSYGQPNKNDWAYSITTTSDGGYIVAGAMDANPVYQGNTLLYYYTDIMVFKLDGYGNLIWQKRYGGVKRDDSVYSIIRINNSYIVSGWSLSLKTYSDGTPKMTALVLALDNNGNILWQRTYITTGSLYFNSASPTSDGGYITVGSDFYNGWIVKLDSNGINVWQKIVISGYTNRWNNNFQILKSIIQTSDGGYLAFGWSVPNGIQARSHAWIIKFSSLGNIQWQKLYGLSFSGFSDIGERAYDVIQDGDNFIVTGLYGKQSMATPSYFWIFKLDNNGNIIWQKQYGEGEGRKIIKTSDGNYLAVGTSGGGVGSNVNWRIIKLTPDGGSGFNTAASLHWTNIIPISSDGILTNESTTITPYPTDLIMQNTNEIFN